MQGEEVVREYTFPATGSSLDISAKKSFSTVRREKGTASVCVTNRRVICRVQGKNGIIDRERKASVYQMHIKNVGDIRTAAAKQSKALPIILIILGILTLMIFIGFGLIIAGIVLFIIRKPLKIFDIRSVGGAGENSPGVVIYAKREKYVNLRGYETMANEIGALIADLQTYGDDAIPAWVQNPEQ